MRSAFTLASFLVACAPSQVQVRSVCDEFPRFAKSGDTSLAGFNKDVAPKSPYYAWKIARWEELKKSPDQELAAQVDGYPKIAAHYERICGGIEDTVARHVRKFREAFPDFVEPLEIDVLHSLGEMDGGARTINGKSYFLLGVDGIAHHHPEGDQAAFFQHELFHFYHAARAESNTDDLWQGLWVEGLATYVSHTLSSNGTPQELLLDVPPGTYAKCEANVPGLAAALRKELRSRDPEVYKRWFQLSGGSDAVPVRAGYCLGEKVAARVAHGLGLQAAAKLQGEALFAQIDAALGALSITAEEKAVRTAPGATDGGQTDPTD